MNWPNLAIPCCEIFGIFALFGSLAQKVPFRASVIYALDFWMAAGLLRLSEQSNWRSILVAAVVIGVRKLSSFSLKKTRLGPLSVGLGIHS